MIYHTLSIKYLTHKVGTLVKIIKSENKQLQKCINRTTTILIDK